MLNKIYINLKIIADQKKQNIVARIKKVGWYTIIADEVIDASNREQLSLVFRYVIREYLVCFSDYDSGISSRALSGKIMMCFQEYGLDHEVRHMM